MVIKITKDKRGNRFLVNNRKRIRIKSKLSDGELLKHLIEILYYLHRGKKKTSRRKSEKKTKGKQNNPPQPELTTSITPSDLQKFQSYQQTNAFTDRKKEEPHIPPFIELKQVDRPQITGPEPPKKGEYKIVDETGNAFFVPKSKAKEILNKSQSYEDAVKELKKLKDKTSEQEKTVNIKKGEEILIDRISAQFLRDVFKKMTGKMPQVSIPRATNYYKLKSEYPNFSKYFEQKASTYNENTTQENVENDFDNFLDSYEGEGLSRTGEGLWNYEIDDLMKKYIPYGFKGSFPIDKINDIKFSSKEPVVSFIMNTEPSTVKFGHWVGIYMDKNNLEYYDPLGREPSEEFMERMKPLVEKFSPGKLLQFKINRVRYQRSNSYNCGWFSIQFLIDRYNGIPFKECSGFTKYVQSIAGEKRIQKLKNHISHFGSI